MFRETVYQSRIKKFSDCKKEFTAQSGKLSNYRFIIFLAALPPGVVATLGNGHPVFAAALYAMSALCFCVFVVLVIKHRKVTKEEGRFRILTELNQHSLHRIRREWSAFPVPEAPDKLCQLPESQDLDLFGPASLFHLLSTQRTPQGRATLAQWIIDQPPAEEIGLRQVSAKALSEHLDWRQNLAVIGETLAVDQAVIIPQWMIRKIWLTQKNTLIKYLRFAPWLTLLSIILTFILTPIPFALIVIGINITIVCKYKVAINESLAGLAKVDQKIRSYAEIFNYIKSCPVKAGEIETLIPEINEASEAMLEFNSIATGAAARGSLIHPLLNAVAGFDLQVVKKLESWQTSYGKKLSTWFEALGKIEALTSISNLYYDEPDWTLADFKKSGGLQSKNLGHPLIYENSRVGNDVSLGPEGRFLLVTGSNMAGKSTLLRSIGLNTILARVGAPVCAASLITPPLTIATSMSVQDSLADGVSFFMAELQRIKQIVNLTIEENKKGRIVLFLLDEILQGTNTVERREIVQRVIAHLVRNHAMGAITTHDLALAEVEELTEHADLIHFREHFERDPDGKPKMTFDYKVRPGVATTTNALKILEVIEMPI